jgi:hypothetical protein
MSGTTNYPSALDNDTTLPVDKTDDTLTATDHPAHHNNLATAVRAIEAELGTDPSGANYSTVKDAIAGKVDFSPTAEQIILGTGDIVGLTVKATAAQSTKNVFQMRLNNNAIGAFIDKDGNFSAQALKIAGAALAAANLANGVTGTGAVVLAAAPTLTGVPLAPTAAVDTSTTQLATTAFVLNQAAGVNPVMDGAVAIGTSTRYARADHVHPTDTSVLPKASPTVASGPLTLAASGIVFSDSTSMTTATASVPATNAQVGTTYTFVLGDAQNIVELSNVSAISATVPPNSSVAYPVGTVITLFQTNTGQVTVVAGAGVTINGNPGLKIAGQWGVATLIKRATNTWIFFGNTSS